MAVTTGLAYVTVTIGDSRMTFETNSRSPLSYFEAPLDRHHTGAVSLTLNGKTTTGPEIGDVRGQNNVRPGSNQGDN